MTYTKTLMNSMTPFEAFINDVLNDAFLKAVESNNPLREQSLRGKITLAELDQIIYAHPYYEEVSMDTIEDAVVEIEKHLEKDNRLAI